MNVAFFLPLLLSTAPEHGPSAPTAAFPSHDFQVSPHRPDAQLSFHYGVLQPILLSGFNAAVDVRLGRWIFTYSHGQGLDFTDVPGALSSAEDDAGLSLMAPFSTGFGIGAVLLDELYVLLDFKWHRFEVELAGRSERYSTFTLGGEIGYRLFVWKGFHIAPVLRFWPNIADTVPDGGIVFDLPDGNQVIHSAAEQGSSGFFANVLVGWAFDL